MKVDGYENDRKFIVYNFDWKVIGQFDNNKGQQSAVKVRLLNRNSGLLVKSMEMEENRINICKYGTTQENILDVW